MLAEHSGVDMPTAFAALRSYARGSNQKIGVVSDALVQQELDPSDVLPPSG